MLQSPHACWKRLADALLPGSRHNACSAAVWRRFRSWPQEPAAGSVLHQPTAYRSFTYPKAQVHAAALQALERMQIQKTKDERNGDAIRMRCRTEHLKIYITLAPITPTVTKVSINAKKNWFMKDQTVAVEILSQMDQALGRADPARSPAEEVR